MLQQKIQVSDFFYSQIPVFVAIESLLSLFSKATVLPRVTERPNPPSIPNPKYKPSPQDKRHDTNTICNKYVK